jgi:hypothetical protein
VITVVFKMIFVLKDITIIFYFKQDENTKMEQKNFKNSKIFKITFKAQNQAVSK